MFRKLVCASLVTGAVGLFAADDVLAHGGIYRGPGDGVGGGGGQPGTGSGGGDPGNPPGPSTPGPGPGPSTPGPLGGPTGPIGPANGGKGVITGVGAKKNRSSGEGFDAWQYWWEYNKDRFIDIRARLADSTAISGSGGFLNGQGRTDRATHSTRPDADEVANKIVPLLRSMLAQDDADIVDSAVLSLGRIVDKDQASLCLADLKSALGNTHSSVRQSALLSLGVLGSKEAIPWLAEVLNDTSEGRRLAGLSQQVPQFERAFAAIALGFIGSVDSIPLLKDAITKNTNSERDIRALAVVALGMFEEGKEQISPFLTDLLKDSKLDENIAAQIPVSLARLGAEASIPQLQKLADGRKTPRRVVESAILALAELSSITNDDVTTMLKGIVKDHENDQARHFAILALAEITARSVTDEANEKRVTSITKFLVSEMRDAKRKAHEPWAGIGLAILGAKVDPASRLWTELVGNLTDKFEGETNPSYRGAYAIALGIMKATMAGPAIQEVLVKTREAGLRGYCAVSLGMMRHVDAKQTIRDLVLDDSDPKLRLQAATALGLLGDIEASDLLLRSLKKASTAIVISSLARAVGLIGDRSAIADLSKIVLDENASGLARGFGCVALGLLAEKSELPWNAGISIGINYRTEVPALREILDIL